MQRRKLPDERKSITHKFDIAGHEGYITVGMYEDGTPGEIFVTMSKQGSTISGLMDSFATAISFALQYGVPLQFLVDKFSHMRFEPSGFTKNPQIPYAKSIVDYLFRWMASKFLDEEAKREVGIIESEKTLSAKSDAAAGRDGSNSQPARRQGRRHPAGVHQPGRRAAMPGLRQHNGAQRRLLQMHELRHHERVLIRRSLKGPGELGGEVFERLAMRWMRRGGWQQRGGKKVSASPRRKMGMTNSPGPT